MYWMLFFIPTVLFVVDCAKNRRDTVWFFILICLGPLGALAYAIYFWESITFPIPLAKTFRQATAGQKQRKCPHCGRWMDKLYDFEDGRARRLVCSICRDELSAARR